MHVSAVVAAVALEYFPPSHAEQGAEPGVSLYLPATQLTQGAPLGPVNPLMQEQSLGASLPCSEFDMAGQGAHSAAIEKEPGVPHHANVVRAMILPEGHQRLGSWEGWAYHRRCTQRVTGFRSRARA